MSGFSPSWLALREPADHAARNRDVLAAAIAHVEAKETICLVDLGCGGGSNLRGFALALPQRRQHWTLVDYDPALLAAARSALSDWAQEATMQGDILTLKKDGRVIDVAFWQADLSGGIDHVLDDNVDLVTAAAFFDLVSAGWIGSVARTLKSRALPLYTVLIYDGREAWVPPHPADEAVNAAFNTHQLGDKGFGPAAGPGAAKALADALSAQGFTVTTGDSPWLLDDTSRQLVSELATGIAGAAVETGRVTGETAQDWLKAHRNFKTCTIGHTDLFAAPAG